MKKSYKLSPSTLKIFEDCPRCFWLHFNERVKRPRGIFPSLPSGIDKVLKKYFDSYRGKDVLPEELSGLEIGTKLFEDSDLLNKWRSINKGVRWKDDKGNTVMGLLDDLLEREEKLIVLDYKTRGFPLKEDTASYYKTQLGIYTFLLNKNGYDTEDHGYLLFYHPKKVENSSLISFETDLVKVEVNIEDAENLIDDALKTLKGEMPEGSEDCEYCKWAEEVKEYL